MNENIFLIFFKYSIIVSALCIIISHNPINSILALILTFLLSSILLLYLNITFFSILILIVYIGAIAVLFLFVIMLVSIRVTKTYVSLFEYIPITMMIIIIYLITIYYTSNNTGIITYNNYNYINWNYVLNHKENIELIGLVLYTWFPISLIIAGFILFMGLIGAIITTRYK